jgi:flavin reductase (DIM6/NTAB) family NADH-FMN oxidoreductase RutF
VSGDELRAVLGRVPSGVAVVTVGAGGQRLGLTVGSLVGLSLEPPLIAVAISRQAAMHELLREAEGFAVSILAAGQERLADHFARGVPPIAMWNGISTEAGEFDAPLLSGAAGWLECRVCDELSVGTHTLYVGGVLRAQLGADTPALIRVRGDYLEAGPAPASESGPRTL